MIFKKTLSALTLAALSVSPLSQAIAQSSAPDNDYWWPNRLDLSPLRIESVGMDPVAKILIMQRLLTRWIWMPS